MKTICLMILLAVTATVHAADPKLEKRVEELETQLEELKAALAPMLEKSRTEQIVTLQRNKARERMRKDNAVYTRDELKEIETLYQVANKQWRTDEGKESLKKLISKYDKANRTGCALLYLGQMSKGDEREQYLEQAIEDFSDCYYGNGVQVGAYARYYLAYHHKEIGNQEEADELFQELSEIYPDAISHKGQLLSVLINN